MEPFRLFFFNINTSRKMGIKKPESRQKHNRTKAGLLAIPAMIL
jgi:hypothetical protein